MSYPPEKDREIERILFKAFDAVVAQIQKEAPEGSERRSELYMLAAAETAIMSGAFTTLGARVEGRL